MKLLPLGVETPDERSFPESPITTWVPDSSCSRRVLSVTSATAAMLARASPRNPYDIIASRSLEVAIFEVACLSKQSTASEADIPHPLSMT